MMKVVMLLFLCFFVSLGGIAFSASDTTSTSSGGIIFFGITSIIVLISGLVKKCPSCGKWWARVFNDKRELDRKGSYKTVTRRDTQYNNKGELIGHIEREEQVHITTAYFENSFTCKHCRHQWTTVTSTEYEG